MLYFNYLGSVKIMVPVKIIRIEKFSIMNMSNEFIKTSFVMSFRIFRIKNIFVA